jgi:glycosyltransferase involved in cell wall biosynthesis
VKVAIDASSAAAPSGSGIAVYQCALLRHLPAAVPPGDTFIVCYRASRLKHRARFHKPAAANWSVKLLVEPLNLLFLRSLDVFHGADARLPRSRAPALVATVQDLFSLISDEFARDRFRDKKIRRYHDMAARTDLLIVPSEHTKRDVLASLAIDEARIAVVPHGFDAEYRPRPEAEVRALRARYALPERYVLTAGIISTRKHTAGLIRAFRTLEERGDARGAALVIAGKDGFGAGEAHREAADARSVHMLGYVPADDLPTLYAGASVYAFPSLYEGFGLPVLEAMAAGVPVVASNRGSLPEVAGDAALLIDPEDERALVDALGRALADERLREDLRARGFARTAHFSWERTARATYAAYLQAVRLRRLR